MHFFKRRDHKQDINKIIALSICGTQGESHYSYGIAWDEQEGIDNITKCFLGDPNRTMALAFHRILLDIHEKGSAFSPLLSELSYFEKISSPYYPRHRDHVMHSCLVYCLGLYLYVSFPHLKEAIHQQILISSNETTSGELKHYSGGTIAGEFSFRWRLASLLHDVAYPFQMAHSRKMATESSEFLDHLNYIFNRMPKHQNRPVSISLNSENYIDELNNLPYSETLATDMIENALRLKPFGILYYSNRIRTLKDWVDHGIIGSLLICKLCDMLYEYHKLSGQTNIRGVSWADHFLKQSIAHSAGAVAYHNINHTLDVLSADECKALIQLNSTDLLTGLLRISDILQEWGRPLTDSSLKAQMIGANQVRLEPRPKDNMLRIYFETDDDHKDKVRRQLAAAGEFPLIIEIM
jgi:hypothetical protein